MRRGGSVSGAVSLVMIFCVLCLVVFATLTYVTAEREWRLSGLEAVRAAQYYEADAEAARRLAALQSGEETEFSVPIGDTQELRVAARRLPDGTYEISDWSTAYAGEWEANDTIDIWDGDF